jgi:hypothetical protein
MFYWRDPNRLKYFNKIKLSIENFVASYSSSSSDEIL